MTTTDADWAKMTPRQRDAFVAEVVFGLKVETRGGLPWVRPAVIWWPCKRYTSTWPGFGLVVAAMGKEWELMLDSPCIENIEWSATWSDRKNRKYHHAHGSSAASATALAAVRAMEAKT